MTADPVRDQGALKARRRPPWVRRFPPTREGWWFLVATLLVGAAAVNAGLNLLFLVFGMMLFLILTSGIMSELCLRELNVARRAPRSIHAGTPFLMGISVGNEKRRVPTFSLEIEDLVQGRPVDRRCYFLKIPAGRHQETAYRHTIARRGRHRLTGFRLSTRFPFGLIRKSRDVEAPAELVVFPALVTVPDGAVPSTFTAHQALHTVRPSRAGEFHGLREFRQGDDPRHVHWRSSARSQRLLMRESEDETGREVVVALVDPGPSASDAGFECAVSLAASLALKLLGKGMSVGLLAGGDWLPPSGSSVQAGLVLRRLALIERQRDSAAAAPGAGLTALGIPAGLPALIVRAHGDQAHIASPVSGDRMVG